MGGDYEGARRIREAGLEVQTLSKASNVIVGTSTAEHLIERPGDERFLYLLPATGLAWFVRPGDYRPRDFADADVSPAGDTVDLSGSGLEYESGEGPFKLTNAGGALPGGLDATTLYYVRAEGGGLYTLHLTQEGAEDPLSVPVDITSAAGGGTHTIGGMPPVPVSDMDDGYAPTPLVGATTQWQQRVATVIAAPEKLTVVGGSNGDRLHYWFVE